MEESFDTGFRCVKKEVCRSTSGSIRAEELKCKLHKENLNNWHYTVRKKEYIYVTATKLHSCKCYKTEEGVVGNVDNICTKIGNNSN
jgi:hypothetical protein